MEGIIYTAARRRDGRKGKLFFYLVGSSEGGGVAKRIIKHVGCAMFHGTTFNTSSKIRL